jgi:RimJ/RimL family protein N-acetyltransferase
VKSHQEVEPNALRATRKLPKDWPQPECIELVLYNSAMNLVTERLTLIPTTAEHNDFLLELDSDPEVMKYLTNGKPSTHDDVIAAIEGSLGYRWTAFTTTDNAFIGWFGIPSKTPGEFELGYRLRRSAWGHGYATEGSLRLIDYAFRELSGVRVWAQTMAVNRKSRSVMERCGLHYVRTFHEQYDDPIPGTEYGEVEYELLATDYRIGIHNT